jgi:NAD-dependent DNA ligase
MLLLSCHLPVLTGELEQEFLEAMSDYYYGDKPKLTDEEFELLKEELIWAGSKVAILDGDEQRFLEATQAYGKVRAV